MKTPSAPTILVLGAQGMLGRLVFNYLSGVYPQTVWGTVKIKSNNKRFFRFNASSIKTLETIQKSLGEVHYIINCIGILKSNKNIKEMTSINAKFPHDLAYFAERNKSKLIHVSTDSVFEPNAQGVFEDTHPSPIDNYGKTKLEGEPISTNTITVRTSLIGFDPLHHKGLLEWALNKNNKTLSGYTNQIWSGCTTLQFAKLCEVIIKTNSFQTMRDASPVFHFSPLFNSNKHAILKAFLMLMKIDKPLIKTKSEPVSRILQTHYSTLLFLDQQEHSLKDALKNLIVFEKNYLS